MRFKGQARNPRVFSSLNLIIGVCLITGVLILARGFLKEDEAPSVAGKKKVPVSKEIPRQRGIELPSMTPDSGFEKAQDNGDHALSPVAAFPDSGTEGDPAGRVHEKEGVYRTRRGECLKVIAARADVYGDPLKWPSLYRLNRDKFPAGMKDKGDDTHIKELPGGTPLNFVTQQEARENSAAVGDKAHVVNVLSTLEPGRVVAPAVTLMNNGYRVYIVRARVKGGDWIRLRAGFFARRSEAMEARERIMSLLEMEGAWIDFIEGDELQQSAGY